MRFSPRSLLLSLSAALVSCGPTAIEVDASPVPSSELCERLTRHLCEGNLDCCDVGERVYESVEACIEDNLWLCDMGPGADATSGAFDYDADAAGRLSAAIEASAQTCEAVPDLGLDALRGVDAPREGLAAVLEPLLDEGARCGVEGAPGNACVDGTRCEPDAAEPSGGLGGLGGLGAGTCTLIDDAPGGLGAACASGLAALAGIAGTVGCEPGLVCASCARFPSDACVGAEGMTAGSCQPQSQLGEPCDLGACEEGTYCEGWSGVALGTCAPVKADGEPCTGGQECAAGHCEGASLPPYAGGTCGAEPGERSHCLVWRGRIG
jgi:hypothetical protein